jgi:hypothetical protein
MNLNLKFLFILNLYLIIKGNEDEDELRNDFCNINESKAAYYIMKDITNYFKLKNDRNNKCLVLNEYLVKYYERFNILEIINKNSYSSFKCGECEKIFKNKGYLYLHYKLFHLTKLDSNYYCPADLCIFMNCDRYKSYLGIPFPENSIDKMKYNRPVREKYQECNKNLIVFYKSTCMKLIGECFDHFEFNIDNYFEFYENFCMKIECGRDTENPQISYNLDLPKEGSIWDAIRMVILYIVSIFAFIFILIIWISKNT